ncbi:MAG TPA: DUF2064 domain-containing protein, partial [Ilumatobacteraceae bacterium]
MTVGAVAIIVLAKAPVAGLVKTRCTPPCTPEQAAALARAALEDSLWAARWAAADRLVLALDGDLGDLPVDGFDVIGQRGTTLGERIDNAFADVAMPALLIGMDTPQVSASALAGALRMLRRGWAETVVGPARDGGFWLLGQRRAEPGLCAHVPMSRDDTLLAL